MDDGGRARDSGTQQRRVVSLLQVWPEIEHCFPGVEQRAVERVLAVPLHTTRDQELDPVLQAADAFDFAVVDGTVLKETTLAARSALELLGAGDVLAPPLSPDRQLESRATSRYVALGDVWLAELGSDFRRAAARWPKVMDFLHSRLAEQTHHASMHLAMLHLPRADDRVIALFSDLAERYGVVTAEGILIDLPLTHELIGRLIGSRRPTVSIALQALDEAGTLSRRRDGRWLLTADSIAVE